MQNIYYISQFNPSTPQGQAPANTIDDELRQIKSVIKNTFPQFDRAIEFSAETLNILNRNIQVTADVTAFTKPIRVITAALDIPSAVLTRAENDLRYVNLPEFTLLKYVPSTDSASTDLLDAMFKRWTGAGRIQTDGSAAKVLSTFINDLFFPVNHVVFTTGEAPTHPGTWVKISGGRYVVTEGSYWDAETVTEVAYRGLDTGGKRSFKVKSENLPEHTHMYPLGLGSNDTAGEGSGTRITVDSNNDQHQYGGTNVSLPNVTNNLPITVEPQFVVLAAWRRIS